MLHEAQASSSTVSVVHVLDKVIDILKSTELFDPQIRQVKEEDPLTNDYVEGLCDVRIILSKTRVYSNVTSAVLHF